MPTSTRSSPRRWEFGLAGLLAVCGLLALAWNHFRPRDSSADPPLLVPDSRFHQGSPSTPGRLIERANNTVHSILTLDPLLGSQF